MSNDVLTRNGLSSVDNEKPFASYTKTILGQVGVNMWDRFTSTPTYIILNGDPRRKEPGCVVDVWDAKEDSFFRRNNFRHFERGILVPFTRQEEAATETPIEQFSDEQLKEIVNSRFLALQAKLNKIESVAVLFRMITIATEEEKSSKITDAIEARISELQMVEDGTSKDPKDEE